MFLFMQPTDASLRPLDPRLEKIVAEAATKAIDAANDGDSWKLGLLMLLSMLVLLGIKDWVIFRGNRSDMRELRAEQKAQADTLLSLAKEATTAVVAAKGASDAAKEASERHESAIYLLRDTIQNEFRYLEKSKSEYKEKQNA